MITGVINAYLGGNHDGSFLFDGVDDYIEYGAAPVTAAPCTIMGWMRAPDDDTEAVCSIGNSAGSSRMRIAKITNPNDNVAAGATNSGGTTGDASGGNFIHNAWQLLLGTFTSTTLREMFLNGNSVATNTSNITVSGLNSLLIGARYSGGVRGAFIQAYLAHIAVWDIVLSGADITALDLGAKPDTIQPGHLVFYAPLTGGVAKDMISNTLLTVFGAVSNSNTSPAGI